MSVNDAIHARATPAVDSARITKKHTFPSLPLRAPRPFLVSQVRETVTLKRNVRHFSRLKSTEHNKTRVTNRLPTANHYITLHIALLRSEIGWHLFQSRLIGSGGRVTASILILSEHPLWLSERDEVIELRE